MTHTIGGTFPVPREPSDRDELRARREAGLLREQAKGVLIFRYSIGARQAEQILQAWATQSGAGIDAVAHVLVHDICQGDCGGHQDPWLVRWVEDSLRREHRSGDGTPTDSPVSVDVDHSEASLDDVVEGAHRAAATGVPLCLSGARLWLETTSEPCRRQVLQRLELAAELARAVEPGLDVRTTVDVGGVGDGPGA